jgi:hypothetical protein
LKRAPLAAALVAALILPAALAAGCSSAAGSPAAAPGSADSDATVSAVHGPADHASASGSNPGTATSQPGAVPAEQLPAVAASKLGPASALPDSVWISPAQIPLDSAYHWQSPAAQAYGSTAPQFEFEQLCQTTKPNSVAALAKSFTSATATLTAGANITGGAAGTAGASGAGVSAAGTSGASGESGDDWLAQEVVTHDPSLDSASDQVAFAAFADLTSELQSCAQAVAGAQVTVSTDSAMDFAATLTIPTSTGATATLHDYLVVPDGTIAELALWVAPNPGDQPAVPWSNVPDSSVLSALRSPVCETYKDC